MVFVDIKNNTVSLPQTVLKIPCQKYSGFGGTNKPGKFFTSYQKHPRFVAAGTAGNVLTSCQKDPNFLAINTAGECPDLGQKKKIQWFHPYKCSNALLKSSDCLCNLRRQE